ncbi:MAG TPA: amidoligase family protein [Microvirga sp.]|jgi:hypothetical protein
MSSIPALAAAAPAPFLTFSGVPRRVGVEIEFLGIGARRAAAVLAGVAGGDVVEEDPHAFRIRGTALGDLAVEMDLRHLHAHRHPNLGVPRLAPHLAHWLGQLAAPFVPRELITGPIEIGRLTVVDSLIVALRQAGARGRGVILFDALSMHFNIDPPQLDAPTLTAYMRAYLRVDGDLRREVASGWRQAAALPPDFPPAYRQLVLQDAYRPDLDTFAADYLAANPTRKRALDLLPILSVLAPERVHRALPHEKIGPRPVLHYRLPQAHVSDPAWSIMPDWQLWLRVEALALDELAAKAGSEPRSASG